MHALRRLNADTAFLALILGALGIAFAPILAKLAVNGDGVDASGATLSPVAVAFWRMAIAAPIFAGAAAHSGPRPGPSLPRWPLLVPGLFFALDLGTWHWSFEFTSVANSTLEANFAVVLVSLAGWLWLKERFNYLFPVGALFAIGGMVALVGASFGQAGDAWIGDLMGLGTAFFYTGYQLAIKLGVARYPIKLVMACTCAVSAGFLALGALALPGRFVPQTGAGWGAVVILSLVAQVFGQGLIAYGMSRLPASLSSVVLILQPVLAALLGWLMLSQPLSGVQVAAGGFVILGIFLARRGSLPG